MHIIGFKGTKAKIAKNAYISEGVYIIGDVTIEENSNIWFGCILRGDVAPIVIGANTNIQDGTIIHTSRTNGGTYIGNNVTIGHRAIIHAARLMDNSFIGMGATVMDKAIIEPFAIVAAGALVTQSHIVKGRELWAGVPAKFLRNVSDEEAAYIEHSAKNYVAISKEYKGNKI